MSGRVNVVVGFCASEGNEVALQSLLLKGRDISRRAPGCESFELFRRKDDPKRFVFLETWTSIDAHHRNMAENIVASGHIANILPLLAGPIDNGVLELI
jgi:quinol monooxygenase YgiN